MAGDKLISGSAFNIWTDVNKGVAQGTILGPLLCNIFKNDLFSYLANNLVFATTPMTISFHFHPRVYLMCYQICCWIVIMPLSGLATMA